jgi:hypothetical protein
MSKPEKFREKQKPLNACVRYSSLAVQMMLIIAVGTYGGFRLDEYSGWDFPVFIVVLSLLSVWGAIWFAVKDL